MTEPDFVVESMRIDPSFHEAIVIAEAEHVAAICERAYYAALDPGIALKLMREVDRRTELAMLGVAAWPRSRSR